MSKATIYQQTANQLGVNYDFSSPFIRIDATNNNGQIKNNGAETWQILEGTVLGVAADGYIYPTRSDATDGSQVPIGVSAKNCIIKPGETITASICTAGEVIKDLLIFALGSDNLDTLVNGRPYKDLLTSRSVRLVLKSVEELLQDQVPFIQGPTGSSIQTFDYQYTLQFGAVGDFNFDYNEAFSASLIWRYDHATDQKGSNAIVLLDNRTAGGKGWQIAFLKTSQQLRILMNDGTGSDIVTFSPGFTPVVGQTYCTTFTADGARNYTCHQDKTTRAIDTSAIAVTTSTVSTETLKIGTNLTETDNVRFRGLFGAIMFCNKVLTLDEHLEFYNNGQLLEDYSQLSYAANVTGYFTANDYNGSAFVSQVGSATIPTPNGRDYFKRPYGIYSWDPNPTIEGEKYVNNPIIDGTSINPIESYAGDFIKAIDGDFVGVVKSPDDPFTFTTFFIFKGPDPENLVEINKLVFPLANFPVNEIGTVRIRQEQNGTYYLIVRRQLTGPVGGSGERDICILETTDLTTSINSWTQHLGIITDSMVPYESVGTGDWGLFAPADMFKYGNKYYMTAYGGDTAKYLWLFESDSITSGWAFKTTLFTANEQDYLNLLNTDPAQAPLVQGGSIVQIGNLFYICVTLGLANDDVQNERFISIGVGSTPFSFQYYKTTLATAGALGEYDERRVYDGLFVKKSDSNWLTLEEWDQKGWIVYSGHSLVSGRPNAWQSNGKLSLLSFNPKKLIS